VNYGGKRMMGFNNIELISDRPLEINLREITEVVKMFPDRAMIVSLMADNNRTAWHELIKKCEDAGAMGFELNFGCPHGMTERGMGAAVGQDPEIAKMVVEWVMEKATIPVITKLTPNVHSVVPTARGAVEGGTNALSLINTIQSVTGVDLDTLVPNPYVAGQSVFGGYCGRSGQADCAQNAHDGCARSGRFARPDFRDWRCEYLERRRGVHVARCDIRTGLHRRDEPRISNC
jgi:dihydropyrimidine dehydrogenase (NAD+) subunit PreA